MSNYNELKLTYQGGSQETITLTGNTIEVGEYQYRNIVSVEVPEIVRTIGGYAFCDNNDLANIVLNEGLEIIEGQAFQHGVYSAVTIPSTVTRIGVNAFNTRNEQRQDQHTFTVTCLASTPPRLEDPEGITFGDPNLLSAIYVPAGSVSAYRALWRAYASKIQDNTLTNLNIKAAYVGTDEVVKMYLGDELVWGGEPGPDYSKMPLTFKVISGGTITWRATSASFTKEIQYSVNDGPWVSITSTTAGTPISLNTGDIVKFQGNGAISTGQSATNRFRDSTIVFEVYGNIMSLIDRGYTTATTAADHSFRQLFAVQTGLTSAENLVLPATTIGTNVYKDMFKGCISLAKAPALPAETLAQSCYNGMFSGCTSLTEAPELPATTLAQECYRGMFGSCTSLIAAPELPATILEELCYYDMFKGCSNLTGIRCHAIDISATDCTTNWVSGVSSTGTFIKHAAGVWPIGDNGVPSGWSGQVVYDSTTYGEYFTCEMLENGYFTIAEMKTGDHIYTTDVDYSLNGGEWHTITITNDGYVFSVSAGDKIRFRGTNTSYGHGDSKLHVTFGVAKNDSTYQTLSQLTTTSFNVYGNIMSLLYGDNFSDARSLPSGATGFTFCSLFKNSSVVDASGLILPATGLTQSCYRAMFSKADRLTKSPLFPAEDNSASLCYNYLFEKCTALTHIACFATSNRNIPGFTTGVTSEGVFYKNPDASWTKGATGIPNGWTVVDAE